MGVPDQYQNRSRFLGAGIAPLSALVVSVFLHVVALSTLILLRHASHPHVAVVQYQEVQLQSGPVYQPQSAQAGNGPGRPTHAKRPARLPRPVPAEATEILDPGQPLQEQAKRWTSTVTKSLNFHGIYMNHVYELAVLASGDPPVISPDELPPHYQQYVIVEVTIDTKGRAAEVRLVAGEVEYRIEQKILEAIRKFRYVPAKRDGLAIPSQRDIVIHIPT